MKVKPASKSAEVLVELGPGHDALMEQGSTQRSPFQIKNILVLMDFSTCAQKALRYAVPLAEQNKAAITLQHVLPSYVTGGLSTVDYVQLRGEMRASAESRLFALAAQERKENVEIRFRTAEGDRCNGDHAGGEEPAGRFDRDLYARADGPHACSAGQCSRARGAAGAVPGAGGSRAGA